MKGWSKHLPRNVVRTKSGKYAARFSDHGCVVYVGSFGSIEEAVAARDAAEKTAVKLREIGRSLHQARPNYWVLRAASPERRMIGAFETRWAAQQAIRGTGDNR